MYVCDVGDLIEDEGGRSTVGKEGKLVVIYKYG